MTPEQRRRRAVGLMAAQYDGQAPTYSYDFQGAPLSPAVEAFKAQRGQPGVIQKTLGLVPGLDAEGRRGAQSWTNALMSTAQFPIDMIEGAGQAIIAPMRAYRGEFDPMTEQGIGEALNVAGTAMTGGLAAPKPNNTVGIFGGRLAKTADQAKLAQAEDMAARGLPREQIWNDTGWFKGVDGKWRFEIDDRKLDVTGNNGWIAKAKEDMTPVERVKDLFFPGGVRHTQFFDSYPSVSNSTYVEKSSTMPNNFKGLHGTDPAGFSVNEMKIELNQNRPTSEIRGTAAHEMQHAVQKEEGFAGGGNPAAFSDDIVKQYLDKSRTDTNNPLYWLQNSPTASGMMDDLARNNLYNRLAGEVESRTAQKRLDLTPEQRAARPPWLDYDVPEANQIVRFSNDGPQLSAESRPGAARAAVSSLDNNVPGIGHNRPPPTVNINGREIELDPNRLSNRYANNSDLNEMLLQNGGNIDAEIAFAQKELALRQRNLAEKQPWATQERVTQAKNYLDEVLNYRSGLGKAVVDETPVDAMPFGQTWYHATNAKPFDEFIPSAEGALGPGVYLGAGKTPTKAIIPDSEKFSGEGPRRLLSVQHRGNLMPYNDYLRLAESVAPEAGIQAGSTEMSKALAPVLRRYGYSGVADQSGDYGRFAAIFDPSDTRIIGQELYANGGRPGAAAGAALGGQRETLNAGYAKLKELRERQIAGDAAAGQSADELAKLLNQAQLKQAPTLTPDGLKLLRGVNMMYKEMADRLDPKSADGIAARQGYERTLADINAASVPGVPAVRQRHGVGEIMSPDGETIPVNYAHLYANGGRPGGIAGAAISSPNDPAINELLRRYGIELPKRQWANAMLPGDA